MMCARVERSWLLGKALLASCLCICFTSVIIMSSLRREWACAHARDARAQDPSVYSHKLCQCHNLINVQLYMHKTYMCMRPQDLHVEGESAYS